MFGLNNIILVPECPAPITIICESCGHKVVSYCELPDSMQCPACDKPIDLK
jgi:hypothetical protein